MGKTPLLEGQTDVLIDFLRGEHGGGIVRFQRGSVKTQNNIFCLLKLSFFHLLFKPRLALEDLWAKSEAAAEDQLFDCLDEFHAHKLTCKTVSCKYKIDK